MAPRENPYVIVSDGREFGMRSRRLTLGDRIRIELDLHLVRVP